MNNKTAPINKDVEAAKIVRGVLTNPAGIANKSDIPEIFDYCIKRLERVRMGGRSTPLLAACLLLWHKTDVLLLNEADTDKLINLGLHIAGDPSYVHPEAGILLIGIILAKYINQLSSEVRIDISKQTKLMLRHLEKNALYPKSINSCARVLLTEWNFGFKNGLMEIVRILQEEWPHTESIASIPTETLKQEIERLNEQLPRNINVEQRKFYRLYLETNDQWYATYLNIS